MTRKGKGVGFIISILAAVVLTGCDFPYTVRKADFFHGDEPRFKPGPAGGIDQVDITEGADFTRYKMVIIDPVLFQFSSPAQYNAIPRGALENLRRDFRRAFTEALADAYPVVDSPRPDALRLRTLITGLVPAIPGASAEEQWGYLSTGGASMKAELLDSMTSERLIAGIDTKTGEQLPAVQGRDEWVHAREAFTFWGGRLRSFLDTIHGKK
ncbi:MAG: DUF3313 domain-containing protein [Nitrospiraceae bacterium]|nr:MAG: DUF3313 domain-containing protein [Nitrospiraceae bacterium]